MTAGENVNDDHSTHSKPDSGDLYRGFRAVRHALAHVTGAALPASTRDALARLAAVAMNAGRLVVIEDGPAEVEVQAEWAPVTMARQLSLSRATVHRVSQGPSWVIDEGGWTLGVPVHVQGKLWGAALASGENAMERSSLAEERLGAFGAIIAAAVMNNRDRVELDHLLREQRSLRYVAEKVASSIDPDEVFEIVVREVGILTGVQGAKVFRYETDGTATFFAGWGPLSGTLPTGSRLPVKGTSVAGRILSTGVASRVDDYPAASGDVARLLTSAGMQSAVGVPIRVNGRLWGGFAVGSSDGPLPPETEERLGQFAGLISSMIGNLVARQALLDSRTRLIHAADSTRQRIERDLHDGVQQKLVAAKMATNLALDLAGSGEDPRATLIEIDKRLGEAIDHLREISRGIHPSILSEGGLVPALRSLARRVDLPVQLVIDGEIPRFEPRVEVAAYFVVSESLTNALKHSGAHRASIRVSMKDDVLRVTVHDDGGGGADPTLGTGLIGLTDRVEVAGGVLTISSPQGDGTTISARIPVGIASLSCESDRLRGDDHA